MTESQVLGVVADLVMQEAGGGGVNVADSLTSSRIRGVTDSMIRREGQALIEDKINRIFDEIQRDNRDFEESYQGLGISASKASVGGLDNIANSTGAFAGISKPQAKPGRSQDFSASPA